MIQPDYNILNQRGTPMFFSDVFANRPAAGVVGRIFISTDTKEFYRDTGTTWELMGGPGAGTITGSGTPNTFAIFTGASTIGDSSYLTQSTNSVNLSNANLNLPNNNTISGTNYGLYQQMATSDYWKIYGNSIASDQGELVFEIGDNGFPISSNGQRFRFFYNASSGGSNKNPFIIDYNLSSFNTQVYITDTQTYSTGTIQSQTIDKQLTIPNGASISGSVALTSQLVGGTTTFQGSTTIPNSTALSNNLISNSFAFSGAGTVSLTQAAGIRAASSNGIQTYFSGTASSTISHYAANFIYGFYNINSGSITPVIQNAYMLLINDMNDYSHTFTFNNRWGIYQAGANDKNYFAATTLIGTTIDAGQLLQVNGSSLFTGIINLRTGGTGNNGEIILGVNSSFRGRIFYDGTTNGQFIFQNSYDTTNNNGGFLFQTRTAGTPVNALLISGDGNLGINTTTPTAKLTVIDSITTIVSNDGNGYARFSVAGGSVQLGLQRTGTSAGIFYIGGDQNFFSIWNDLFTRLVNVTQTGNLLIGTNTDAGFKLDVNGSSVIRGFLTTTDAIKLGANTTAPSSTDSFIFRPNDNTLGFGTASAEAMRITSNRNLLIGSTTDQGQKLYLNGSLRIDGQTSGTAGGNSGQHLIINCDGTTYKIALLNP